VYKIPQNLGLFLQSLCNPLVPIDRVLLLLLSLLLLVGPVLLLLLSLLLLLLVGRALLLILPLPLLLLISPAVVVTASPSGGKSE
jgi:hypothetical protein